MHINNNSFEYGKMKLDSDKKIFLKNVLFTFIAFAVYKLIGKFAVSRIENSIYYIR